MIATPASFSVQLQRAKEELERALATAEPQARLRRLDRIFALGPDLVSAMDKRAVYRATKERNNLLGIKTDIAAGLPPEDGDDENKDETLSSEQRGP
eukprot:CAMPEP_0181495464 /NCGR_PEP_ID=MMETSP1110-20121109/52392_1 /TAXON_ID=174948 /ORGANISM="Symbiodinium sp., Strain CCMP421" /LENGTH=96 /DNA_ID=CAMNT_0023623091 /DNA_START=37 /DNA_END=327 /DNA_ORIENTATION=-